MKYRKYTEEQRKQALLLFTENNNASETAHKLSIPRHTIRGWVAGGVTKCEEDKSKPINPLEFTLSQKKAYSYVLGLYLGDGCISKTHRENVFRLRISMDEKYKLLNLYVMQNLEVLFPNNKVSYKKEKVGNYGNFSVYSAHLTSLFPHCGTGLKHNRKIELAQWQNDIIAPNNLIQGLFHSDGSFYMCGNKYPAFCFINMSYDIKLIYKAHLNKIGLTCSDNLNAKRIYTYGEQAIMLKYLIGTKKIIHNILGEKEVITVDGNFNDELIKSEKGERETLTATVVKFGKRNYLPSIETQTVLFKNIKNNNDIIVMEECWLNIETILKKMDLSIGDSLRFNSRIENNRLRHCTKFEKLI